MDSIFHVSNRNELYKNIPEGSLLISFAGDAPRMSADTYYHFHATRNFVYLTGLGGAEAQGFILLAEKSAEGVGSIKETIFALPKDMLLERWNGKRLSFDEVSEISGIHDVRPISEFENTIHRTISKCSSSSLYLDLERYLPGEPDSHAHRYAKIATERYPQLCIKDYHHCMRVMRTIKKPCEIEAMKRAMEATKAGILAMMRASKPGIYEYELLAEFNYACTKKGVLIPSSQPIIASGENNFCIHYYNYTGQAQQGDMILVDAGAYYDNIWNDVSRTWPVDGVFNERQRLLYECAYKTSEYMFGLIKPGMPMVDVDLTIRKHCFEYLKELNLVDTYENAGKLIWHGGAHHVGYDVHDAVDMTKPVSAGMVFCVDIGIYCEEWGIGFRLEDNCLVTETGCENLSAGIPRSIKEIEDICG